MFDYVIDGIVLERVSSFKDLGITVSADLSWNLHIANTVSKCNRVNGLIKRAVGYRAPPEVTMQLFNSLSRSVLEYCSPVWSPSSVRGLVSLERVQRNMTRFALHYPENFDYRDRCIELHTLPLAYRREMHDVTLLFKCRTSDSQPPIDISNYVQFYDQNGRRTGSAGPLLKTPYARTESFMGRY